MTTPTSASSRSLLPSRACLTALALCLALGCTASQGGGAPADSGGTAQGQGSGDSAGADAGPVAVEGEAGALRWRVGPANTEVQAPLSLTASDGTGLKLVALQAKAVVEEPLAFTELHLTFRNPEPRVLEGRFEIDLPPGAAISRFAMKIGDTWQEAEVLERQRAQQVYEDFLHRRQDPALLEKKAGNQFSARVFPIPAGATKEIIVAYSEELDDAGEPYRLLMRGLPKLDQLDVEVMVARPGLQGADVKRFESLRLQSQAVEPTGDLDVVLADRKIATGLRYGSLMVARVAPKLDLPPEPPRGLTVLFDSSASRALGYEQQVDHLLALLAAMAVKGDFPVRVVAFDQRARELWTGQASAAAGARAALIERGALGASDVAGALRWLASNPDAHDRLLVVTDGIMTVGDGSTKALGEAVAALAGRGLERVDALVQGGIRDDATLEALTRAQLQRTGAVIDGRMRTAAVVDKLTRATKSGIEVKVPGAAWVWPRQLDGVQEGDQFVIYADVPAGTNPTIELEGVAQVTDIEWRDTQKPLIGRAWAQARVDLLQSDLRAAADPATIAKLKQEVIDTSVRERVLSDYTALLVLETEDDYRRYGIERAALADILVVGQGGLEVQSRQQAPWPPKPMEPDAMPEPEPSAFPWGRRPAAGARAASATAPTEEARAEGTGEGKGAVMPSAPPPPAEALDAMLAKKDEASPDSGGRGLPGGVPGGVPAGVPGGVPGGTIWRAPQDDAPVPAGDGLGGLTGGGGATADAATAPQPASRVPARPDNWRDPFGDEEEREIQRGRGAGRRIVDAMPEERPRPFTGGERAAPLTDNALDGELLAIMGQVRGGQANAALTAAWAWRRRAPADVLALVALGEAAHAAGDDDLAGRAYGSLIDLFPGRADLRRMAGERLEQLGAHELDLVVDTYRKAVEQRPDHPSSHRLYAYALLRADRPEEAFAAIRAGFQRSYPGGRFAGVIEILREDAALIAAAWKASRPGDDKRIAAVLAETFLTPASTPSTHFVLHWETDGNDVDLHVYDSAGFHAYYGSKMLPSGGALVADVTTGYGPEMFAIAGPATKGPYRIQANYYSRGPMGYGMGKLQIVEHDGRGGVRWTDRPFTIMNDRATVDLGVWPPGASDKPPTGDTTGGWPPPPPGAGR